MPNRYRFSLDVLDNDSGITSNEVREIIEAALSGAKVGVPERVKRKVKVEKTPGAWHAHYGDQTCAACIREADDGKGQDVTESFKPISI